jgi:hypothetical protein
LCFVSSCALSYVSLLHLIIYLTHQAGSSTRSTIQQHATAAQNSKMPPRPRGPPQKLTPQQFTYFCLGLPIGFIAVTVGLVGLVVVWGEWPARPCLTSAAVWQLPHCSGMLHTCTCNSSSRHSTTHVALLSAAHATHPPTDAEQKLAISNTDFANLWRRAVQHNPFVQAFMLNFGAIGVWWAGCGRHTGCTGTHIGCTGGLLSSGVSDSV